MSSSRNAKRRKLDTDQDIQAPKVPLSKTAGLFKRFQQTKPAKLTQKDVNVVKHAVLAKLTGQDAFPVMGLDEQISRVSSMVADTIAGEGNSMLIIGPRGSGKTALVEQVLSTQRHLHGSDHFYTVRLSGFIHTDEKLAVRAIWQQLTGDLESQDFTQVETSNRNVLGGQSHSDTMSKLLGLLSHPVKAGTLAKSVVFILNEFDLFTAQPRQTLLYNLFDIAQSQKAPIAVIGLTTRVDAVEQLEKRVKSRFGHRHVFTSLSKSMDEFESICKASLHMPNDQDAAASSWNSIVDKLFSAQQMRTHINKLYHRTRSVPDFMASMLVPVSTLNSGTSSEIVDQILAHLDLSAPSKLNGITALSDVATAMLVCAARQQSIYSVESVSFDLAYEEYKALASKMRIQAAAAGVAALSRVWEKEVAKIAFIELEDLGYVMFGKIDVSLAELAGCELGQWSRWCKEI